MRKTIRQGDTVQFKMTVMASDLAAFEGQLVHPVLSTFSLARDAEWTTRQFVLAIREDDEEGIGTFVNIEHISPAFEGEEVTFNGKLDQINGNELLCSVEVYVGDRLIAAARTGQKIFKREKIKKLFQKP
jgi:fluoroacetyl-CoA thioesterase